MDLHSRVSLNRQTLRHISYLIPADMSSTTVNFCLLLAVSSAHARSHAEYSSLTGKIGDLSLTIDGVSYTTRCGISTAAFYYYGYVVAVNSNALRLVPHHTTSCYP